MWRELTSDIAKEEISKLEEKIKNLEDKPSPRTQARVRNLKAELSAAKSMLEYLDKK